MTTSDGRRGQSNTVVQVRLLLSELEGSAAEPPDWEQTGEVDFLYRAGSILVRDTELEQVQALLPGGTAVPVVEGLSRYQTPMPAMEALAILDAGMPAGVPRGYNADYVLYATPRTFCPAREPEESDSTAPDPPVVRDHCSGKGKRVAVVDTGWLPQAATEHLWLAAVDGDVETPLDGAGLIRSYAGHGTFAAGVVRAAAPDCDVYVEGILPYAGAWFESDIVAQLFDALGKEPDVISLQAGTTTRDDLSLLGFDVLLGRLDQLKGTVLVAAAGNDGTDRPFWPAAFEWAVAVGALTKDCLQRAPFSNFGPWVDVYARGVDHVNAFATGHFVTIEAPAGQDRTFAGMAEWSGTSFSTPYVAGCIAAYAAGEGVTGQQAWEVLRDRAVQHQLPGVGPALSRDLVCQHRDDDDENEAEDRDDVEDVAEAWSALRRLPKRLLGLFGR